MRPTFITLPTDFGTRDTYVAQMKGIIATLEPNQTAPHGHTCDANESKESTHACALTAAR